MKTKPNKTIIDEVWKEIAEPKVLEMNEMYGDKRSIFIQVGLINKAIEKALTLKEADEIKFLESLVNEDMVGEEDGTESTEIKKILKRLQELKNDK